MTSAFPARAVGLLTVAAVAWHGAWAATIPAPIDWDPAYYLDVARNIASGAGAVSGAMWHASGPDLPLPLPADLHWMPLPSRILVPFVALLGQWGASVAAVLVAAGWVPVAAGLACRLDASEREVLAAAGLAALGGGYVRFLSTPDSMGVYGLLAGLAWMAVLSGRVWAAGGLAALVALTRGDGFLLAPCLGLVLWAHGRRRSGLGVALTGPGAFGLWTLRCLYEGGPEWWQARQQTSAALHIHELLLGTGGAPTIHDRLTAVLAGLQAALSTALVVGVVLLPVLAGVGAVRLRRRPLVWALLLYAIAMVVVPSFLAPGVAASGSVFRSGAALFPAGCALAVVGAAWLSDLGHRTRGYPPWLLPLLLGTGFWVGTVGLGYGTWQARPAPPVVCHEAPTSQAVFSGRPLLVRSTCGPLAVALFRGEDPEAVSARARRHRVWVAWLPATDPDPLVPTSADAPALLPGWKEWTPGVWLHPDAPSPTVAPSGW